MIPATALCQNICFYTRIEIMMTSIPYARKITYCAEHGRRQNTCVPCGGASICQHKRRKWVCSICNGKPVPQHFCKCGSGKRAAYCKQCKGTGICPCNRRREECPTCNPPGYFRKVVRAATRRAFLNYGGRSARTGCAAYPPASPRRGSGSAAA